MPRPKRIDNAELQLQKLWEKFFSKNISKSSKFMISFGVAILGFLVVALLFKQCGVYYPSVIVFAIILISLYSGLFFGCVFTLVLCILADYYFVSPVGQVLSSVEGTQYFVILVIIGFTTSFLIASLRLSFRRTLIAKQEAQNAVLARDRMIGVISHELKNPLTALGTGVEIIKRILPQDPQLDRVRILVDRLEPSTQRMERLISDLLDVTRLEAKALKLEIGLRDLEKIIKEIVQSVEADAQEKRVQLSSELQSDCRAVLCDSERTGQVLLNLVSNAIKFTNAGGKIHVYAEKINGRVEVRVADTGRGISKENLSHVFDRFWQAQDTAYQGTGLGLAIAKGIVEGQGGSIWVESRVGKGSVFCFTLPTAEAIRTGKVA